MFQFCSELVVKKSSSSHSLVCVWTGQNNSSKKICMPGYIYCISLGFSNLIWFFLHWTVYSGLYQLQLQQCVERECYPYSYPLNVLLNTEMFSFGLWGNCCQVVKTQRFLVLLAWLSYFFIVLYCALGQNHVLKVRITKEGFLKCNTWARQWWLTHLIPRLGRQSQVHLWFWDQPGL